MASWREEYIQALNDRDQREKASYEHLSNDFIDTCKHLRNICYQGYKLNSTRYEAS